MSREKLSRNAPCPCGSGLKYKRCCLEDATRLETLAVAASLPMLFPLLRPQSEAFEAWVDRLNASRDRSWRPSAALRNEGIELLDDAEVERILATPEEFLGDSWRRLCEGFADEHIVHVALLNGAVAAALDEPHSLNAVALELIENGPDLRATPSEMLALVIDAGDLWSVKEADQVEKEIQTISDALEDDAYEVAWLAAIASVAGRCWTGQHARRLEVLVERVRSQLPLTDFPEASRGLATACDRFASEPALAAQLGSLLLADTLGVLAQLGSELDLAA
jgi:hypothetical protein